MALSVPASIGMGLEVGNGVDGGDYSGLAVELDTGGVVFSEGVASDALVLSVGGDRTGSFTAVSAGYWHSCGLRSDGPIVCWGSNDHGEATPPRRR